MNQGRGGRAGYLFYANDLDGGSSRESAVPLKINESTWPTMAVLSRRQFYRILHLYCIVPCSVDTATGDT